MASSPDRVVRRTLGILTLAVASLALAGCSLLGGIPSLSPTDSPSDSSAGDSTDIFTVSVGDCVNAGNSTGEVSEVPVVACSEPHDSEAYASVLMEDGEFPGDEAVSQRAGDECTAAFAGFVGLDFAASELDFAFYYPTESSWAQGDREILCLVVDPAGRSTGSLAGVAR